MLVKAKENYKHWQIESPTNLLYYYTPENAINIALAGVFTSNVTSTFRQFSFQSKQRKEDLLGPYGTYFKGFKLRSPIPSRVQSPPLQPDFGITDSWESTELEKKQEEKEEKESENQEFTYQNPITENLDIKTPNFQTQQNQNLENPEIETPPNQNNQNPDLINQQNLPLNIVIN
ncbi:hypothetical protein G9A89_015570 [Geosiphon pyriformis]|nr:hypothetical protein G9A89_015570 [Geosiphon pyriformis]